MLDPERPPACTAAPAYTPFMSGFASPAQTESALSVELQEMERRSAARHGIALELLRHPALRPAGAPPAQLPAADTTAVCPDIRTQALHVKRRIGLCDKMFRTSDKVWTDLHRDGWPAERGPFFEDACACYRTSFVPNEVPKPTDAGVHAFGDTFGDVFEDPCFEINFEAFTETICGKVVPKDAYGVAGDAVRAGTDCVRELQLATKYTRELVEEIKVRTNGSPDSIQDYAGAIDRLDAAIEQQSLFDDELVDAFYKKLETRALSLRSAVRALCLFDQRVNEHVQARKDANQRHLQQMSDDALARTALYLDPKSAAALMRTCVEYRETAALKARLPHMHVRQLMGLFPHVRANSRDREALAHNQSKPVVRDFVLARTAVRLYVDFALPTLRPTPLKKKERADGLSNIDHDFSDDEYEEPPEALRKRGPQVSSTHDTTSEWGLRQLNSERRKRRLWEAVEGPEEPHDRYMHNMRLPYDFYFSEPLRIVPCLVYADTKAPVPCERSKSGLDLSNQMLRDGGTFMPPRKWSPSDLMPAVAKFHISHLSSDHGGRLFRLRLTGATSLRGCNAPFSQVVYTEPFEVVSKLSVATMASKRRTLDQVREDARKRAKAKPRPVE